jgi:hypothetical protein
MMRFKKLSILIGAVLLSWFAYQLFLKKYRAITITPTVLAQADSLMNNMQFSFDSISEGTTHKPIFYKSIIYPELLRFNRGKDRLEQSSLDKLYLNFGKEHANYSIGLLQMKPSFAEEVLRLKDSLFFKKTADITDDVAYRKNILQQLKSNIQQVLLLKDFVQVLDSICQNKHFETEYQRMQHYALFYNAGLNINDAYCKEKIKEADSLMLNKIQLKDFHYLYYVSSFYLRHN